MPLPPEAHRSPRPPFDGLINEWEAVAAYHTGLYQLGVVPREKSDEIPGARAHSMLLTVTREKSWPEKTPREWKEFSDRFIFPIDDIPLSDPEIQTLETIRHCAKNARRQLCQLENLVAETESMHSFTASLFSFYLGKYFKRMRRLDRTGLLIERFREKIQQLEHDSLAQLCAHLVRIVPAPDSEGAIQQLRKIMRRTEQLKDRVMEMHGEKMLPRKRPAAPRLQVEQRPE